MMEKQLSPLPCVSVGSAVPEAAAGMPGRLMTPAKAKAKKPSSVRGADHIKLRDIRIRLDMTQSEFADALGLITVTLVSYERGQTKKVPLGVMERAEELANRDGEVLEWRKQYDHRNMVEILDEWAKKLGADPTDLPTMAALTGTVTSTISRWRNGECRPSLRELVQYAKNVEINANRLAKSKLLIESSKFVREPA